jgi:hypothetical protein
MKKIDWQGWLTFSIHGVLLLGWIVFAVIKPANLDGETYTSTNHQVLSTQITSPVVFIYDDYLKKNLNFTEFLKISKQNNLRDKHHQK